MADDEIEPLREQFLDAAQALLEAERKEDAGVVSTSEVRKLPNGIELVAETTLAETPKEGEKDSGTEAKGDATAVGLPPQESPDDPPCP